MKTASMTTGSTDAVVNEVPSEILKMLRLTIQNLGGW